MPYDAFFTFFEGFPYEQGKWYSFYNTKTYIRRWKNWQNFKFFVKLFL